MPPAKIFHGDRNMGPLKGLTIIEIAGIGPGPFGAMLLADLGAEVIRVERPGGSLFAAVHNPKLDFLNRNKRCISVNLKNPEVLEEFLNRHGDSISDFDAFSHGVASALIVWNDWSPNSVELQQLLGHQIGRSGIHRIRSGRPSNKLSATAAQHTKAISHWPRSR